MVKLMVCSLGWVADDGGTLFGEVKFDHWMMFECISTNSKRDKDDGFEVGLDPKSKYRIVSRKLVTPA